MKIRTLLILLLVLIILMACNQGGASQEAAQPAAEEATVSTEAVEVEREAETAPEDTPAPAEPAANSTGAFTADFRSDAHGFQFRNYGSAYPEGDLTIEEVRSLFGDQVCAQIEGDTCIPTPAAQLWIGGKNKEMAAGHCVGFTVMSHRLLQGEFTVSDFTPVASVTYDITQDPAIMRHIAQSYAMYYIPGLYKNNAVRGAPMEIVEALLAEQAPVDLGIFANDGAGHSMLAYGVRKTEAGLYEILAYDNNYPGKELAVIVDPATNTWSYEHGAVSPGDTTQRVWAGDADSGTLEFIPLSAYSQAERSCPKSLCETKAGDEGSGGDRGTVMVTFGGEGDLLVTNSQGQQAGRSAGQFINDISGAELFPSRGTRLSDNPPAVEVPAKEMLTIEVNTPYNQLGNLRLVSPVFALAVDGLKVETGQPERLAFSAVDQQAVYTTNDSQQPTFKVAGATYMAVIGNLRLETGSGLDLKVDPETQNLSLAGQNLTDETATLILVQLDNGQQNLFASNTLTIPAGGSANLDITGWDGSGPLAVSIDEDGDGTVDQAITLANQPLGEVIQQAQSGQEIVSLTSEMPAYMNGTQVDSFLEILADLTLSGQDLGQVIFQFELQDNDLVNFINQTDLPGDAQALAQLLFTQHFDQERLDQVISQLNLSGESQASLKTELDKLAAVRAAEVEWDFYNPDDKVAMLPQFLNDQGLAPDQSLAFLKGLDTVSPADKEAVAGLLDISEEDQARILAGLQPAPAAVAVTTPEATPTLTPTPEAAPTLAATPTPAPTPVPAPVAAGDLLGFEAFGSWKRGDQPYGALTQDNNLTNSGAAAGKLAYDFSGASANDDFVLFTQRITIPGEPNLVSTWVHGDDSGVLFNIWLEDAGSEVWAVPLGAVNHTGWQQMTGLIDPNLPWPGGRVFGPDNGVIDYPIRFHSLVIDRTDGPATGMISFDDIAFSSGQAPGPTPTPAPAAATTQPGQTPAPATTADASQIEFLASQTQLKQCQCTQLSWRTENVQAVYLQGQGQVGVGSRQECPWETTTYTLQVFKPDGAEEVRQVTVNVEADPSCVPTPPPPPPPPAEEDDDDDDSGDNNDNNDNSSEHDGDDNSSEHDGSEHDSDDNSSEHDGSEHDSDDNNSNDNSSG